MTGTPVSYTEKFPHVEFTFRSGIPPRLYWEDGPPSKDVILENHLLYVKKRRSLGYRSRILGLGLLHAELLNVPRPEENLDVFNLGYRLTEALKDWSATKDAEDFRKDVPQWVLDRVEILEVLIAEKREAIAGEALRRGSFSGSTETYVLAGEYRELVRYWEDASLVLRDPNRDIA